MQRACVVGVTEHYRDFVIVGAGTESPGMIEALGRGLPLLPSRFARTHTNPKSTSVAHPCIDQQAIFPAVLFGYRDLAI